MLRRQKVRVLGVQKGWLLLRGIAGAIGMTLSFYCLQTLPLASAVSILYLAPLFTLLFAGPMVGEWSGLKSWLFFLLAFVGVLLVENFDVRVDSWGALMGVLGAASAGFAYNIIRKLKNTEHELVVILYFPLVTVPVILPFVIRDWVWPTPVQWAALLGIGVLTQFAQVFMTRGYRAERASKVAIVNYVGVFYALILGWMFFGESIPWPSLMGMLLILVAVWGIRPRKNKAVST